MDFSVRHRPDATALPDGWNSAPAACAVLRAGGMPPVAKLVEGPMPSAKIYDQGLQGQGYRHGKYEGLPHFQESRFSAGYPFGKVELAHPDMSLRLSVVGWSPFVPLDDVASGLPCVILEYSLVNPTHRTVPFEFSFHLSHLAGGDGGWPLTRNQTLPGRGVYFFNEEPTSSESFASASRPYPLTRRSLEYCIRTWDQTAQGVLTGALHNTYGIEFWGADGDVHEHLHQRVVSDGPASRRPRPG